MFVDRARCWIFAPDYGGRLVGAIASGVVGLYVGIDANKETVEANRRLASDLGFSDKAILIHDAAEDVQPSEIGDGFDVCFTSPPYFAKRFIRLKVHNRAIGTLHPRAGGRDSYCPQ